MKILSWNVERPKLNANKNAEIINLINEFDADLIFLTETNSVINLPNYHKIQSKELPKQYKGIKFHKGENEVSIFSKYDFLNRYETYNEYSSVSSLINTEFGELILYGSIIGFTGGHDENFKSDLIQQKKDLKELILINNLCFSGDLNISFTGHPYPSKKTQIEFKEFCKENNLQILTEHIKNSALHIILSLQFLKNLEFQVTEKQIERKISDHNIVIVELTGHPAHNKS